MRPNEYIIVWCDSPLGLISTRVDSQDVPVKFLGTQINSEVVKKPDSLREIFDILKRKDGTKIAILDKQVTYILGWAI